MQLNVRAPLYVNPRARARMRVGKISLPTSPEPEKKPVPKKPTNAPRTRISQGVRAAAYRGITSAAQKVKSANDRLRPKRSAIQPKQRYPGNIPTRFSTTSSQVVFSRANPRPPLATGSVK